MRLRSHAISSALLVLISLAIAPGFAQEPPDANGAPDQDPPARIARLSLTQGAVSLQPAGDQDWATADVNRPLTTGDKLWTDQDSRAELDIGSAAIRLGSATGFSFLNLDDRTAQMQVTAGTVIVRVRSLDQDENFEVDTPNLAVSLTQPGQYRIEVNEAGDKTVVSVAEGEAQAAGDGQGYPIHAQQRATFTGTQQLSSMVASLGAPDELDSWSLSRDRQIQSAQSQEYVSTEATGYADLDNNGRWQDTPDYGYVWTPTTVAVGWAPYRFGHWVWIGPWGWTWVDDASWGFAPFHYGRWVTYRNSWCWVPGPRRVRPVYAPALVGWVGAPGVAVTVGAGVGWFPLGPREVYVPSYRVSPRYVERVNVTNTVIVNKTYITNVYENRVTNIAYMNRNVRGGVTTVSREVFTSAQPVGRHWNRDVDARSWTARAAAPAIIPTRGSLVRANARVSVRQPPAAIMSRQVVARTPPPRGPVSFDRQEAAIRANGGRPLGRADLARLQPSTPVAGVRVVTPQRRGIERPAAANEPSMADRARALRDNRPFGTAEGQRPPIPPRNDEQVTRPFPPRNDGQATHEFPPRNGPQGRREVQPPPQRNESQPPARTEFQSPPRNESPPPAQPQQPQREESPSRNGFQSRGLPAETPRNERFERPQPRVVQPPPVQAPAQPPVQPRNEPRQPFQPRPEPREAPPVRQPPPAPAPQVRQQPPPAPVAPPPQQREIPRPPPRMEAREAPRSPPPSPPERRQPPPGRQPGQSTQDR
jgi:hypothetical protein